MGESLPSVAAAVEMFLDDHLIVHGAPATVATYRSLLRPLLEAHADEPVSVLSSDLFRALILGRLRTGAASSAITAASCWSAFGRYCSERRGWLVRSPMHGVPIPKTRPAAHRYLSRAEIRRLWDACDETPRRSKVLEYQLTVLLLLEGLRASEFCGLRWTDVDRERQELTVHGKAHRVRRIALSPQVLELLAQWRARHPGRPEVFTMTRQSLHGRLRRLGDRAGIPRLKPHLLRHSWASWWMIHVGDTATLQQLGGWTSDRMIREVYARSALEWAALEKARRADLTDWLLRGEERT